MLKFNLHSSRRSHRKFPRSKITNVSTPRDLKIWRLNQEDTSYPQISGSIKKFLMHNVGAPIDKVYTLFKKRCKNINNPKEKLYYYIKNKEDIPNYLGGFYLTNGILNYLKPRPVQRQKKDYSKLNAKRFDTLDLISLVKSLEATGTPQYLGKYYIGGEGKSIYLDNHLTKASNPKYTLVRIAGVGNGLSINYIKKTSKIIKEFKTVNCPGVPLFFFYYKNYDTRIYKC